MDVRCEHCQARNEVDDALARDGGSARCVSCGRLFRVTRGRSEIVTTRGRATGFILRRANGEGFTVKDVAALQKLVVEGQVGRDDEVSAAGEPYRRLGDIPELEPFFAVVEKAKGGADAEGAASDRERPEPRREPRGVRPEPPPQQLAGPSAPVGMEFEPQRGSLEPIHSAQWELPKAAPAQEPAWIADARRGPAGPRDEPPRGHATRDGGSRVVLFAAAVLLAAVAAAAVVALRPGWVGLGVGPAASRPALVPGPAASPAPASAPAPEPSPAEAAAPSRAQEPPAPAAAPAPPPAQPSAERSEKETPTPAKPEVAAPPEAKPAPSPHAAPPKPSPSPPASAEPSARAEAEPPPASPARPARKPTAEEPRPRTPKALLAEAKRLRARGKSDAALDLYAQLVAENPNDGEALAGRGSCYLDMSQYRPAEASFMAALEVDPNLGEALLGLAETYRYEGRRTEAVEYYQKYLAAHPDGDAAVAARNAIEALKE